MVVEIFFLARDMSQAAVIRPRIVDGTPAARIIASSDTDSGRRPPKSADSTTQPAIADTIASFFAWPEKRQVTIPENKNGKVDAKTRITNPMSLGMKIPNNNAIGKYPMNITVIVPNRIGSKPFPEMLCVFLVLSPMSRPIAVAEKSRVPNRMAPMPSGPA